MTREELDYILTVSPGCGWTVDDFLCKDDRFHDEMTLVVKLVKSKELHAYCNTCLYFPPSSGDGKPCTMCDPESEFNNCHTPIYPEKEEHKKRLNGVWLHKNNGVIWWHECSECGKKLLTTSPTRYCSDCGAFMQQPDESPEEDEDHEYYD